MQAMSPNLSIRIMLAPASLIYNDVFGGMLVQLVRSDNLEPINKAAPLCTLRKYGAQI